MRRTACATAVLFLLASWPMEVAGVRPQRRHRSHRWRKADKKKRVQKKKRAATPRVLRLSRGRWREEISEAIEDVLAEKGVGTDGYSEQNPPVAVLSWDDVSITHHVGEALFHYMVSEAKYAFDDAFWERVPVHFGRMNLRAAYNEFSPLKESSQKRAAILEIEIEERASRDPNFSEKKLLEKRKAIEFIRTAWKRSPYYQIYRKGFFKCYRSICQEYGSRKCAVWRVKLLGGVPLDIPDRLPNNRENPNGKEDLIGYTDEAIKAELKNPVRVEKVGTTREDPDPVKIRRGLRWIPEMRDLYKKLQDRGFDVWVISSSNQWSVEEMAREYGVYRSRVVGIRTKLVDGAITDDVLQPTTHGIGKTEAIAMFIGRSPALIIGGENDTDMLGFGRGTRIQVVDSSEALPGFQRERGLNQPRFSPVRKPQERLAGRQ